MSDDSRRRPKGSNLTGEIDPNSEISRKLKAVYREIESEEIPEQFLDLLEKLDAAEQSQISEDDE